MRRKQNRETTDKYPGSSCISPLRIRKVAPRSGGISWLLQPLMYFRSGNVRLTLLILMWKVWWNYSTRLGCSTRLERDFPCLNSKQQRVLHVWQPSLPILQWKARPWMRFSQRSLTPSQCDLLHWERSWECLMFPQPATFHQNASWASSFVEDVPQDCIFNSSLHPGLRNKALEQFYKTNPPSGKQAALTTVTTVLCFWLTNIFVICLNWHGCKRPVQIWKQWDFSLETVLGCEWMQEENYSMVMDVCFLVVRKE